MKRVLMIATGYPPVNTPGALRIGKFTKYLPDFGWEPIVLTAKSSPFFLKGISEEMKIGKVYRVKYFNINDFTKKVFFGGASHVRPEIPSSNIAGLEGQKKIIAIIKKAYRDWFNFPDEFWEWITPAIRIGSSLLKKHRIDLIFSSSPGPSAHIVAERLKLITNLPWIAEFRDPWRESHIYERGIPLVWIEKGLEEVIINKADKLITVSEPLADFLYSLYKKSTQVITNGFDEEDYNFPIEESQKFTITYTGRLYMGRQSPEPLFEAVKEFLDNEKFTSNEFEIRFFGDEENRYVLELAKKYNLFTIVKAYKKIPLKEAIKKQKESIVLLLLEWTKPTSKGVYTTKVFEYLGARRPILAIGPKGGVIECLLKNTRAGILENNPEKLKIILSKWWREWKIHKRVKYKGNSEKIEQYTRKNLTKQLSNIFQTFLT